jgi:hypothetical protein
MAAIVKLTIDGQTAMNGSIGEWTDNPPEILTEQLKANARPAPWMQAVMINIAAAGVRDTGTLTIDVHTRPGGWTLDVQETT